MQIVIPALYKFLLYFNYQTVLQLPRNELTFLDAGTIKFAKSIFTRGRISAFYDRKIEPQMILKLLAASTLLPLGLFIGHHANTHIFPSIIDVWIL